MDGSSTYHDARVCTQEKRTHHRLQCHHMDAFRHARLQTSPDEIKNALTRQKHNLYSLWLTINNPRQRRLILCLHTNRPFVRWRHVTTTSRILQGFAFLCKLRLFFYLNLTGITKFKYERKSQMKLFLVVKHFIHFHSK